ncbi:hypothetical protein GUITHDRAFT_51700, partial [Guillardia theta CCMP2712]
DDLTSTGSFDSVEAFWSYFHHLVRPSDLPNKHDWCMFKCGILPFSHHPDNVGGGKWTLRLKKTLNINRVWEDIMLGVLGGVDNGGGGRRRRCKVDPANRNGVVISSRHDEDIISVW